MAGGELVLDLLHNKHPEILKMTVKTSGLEIKKMSNESKVHNEGASIPLRMAQTHMGDRPSQTFESKTSVEQC